MPTAKLGTKAVGSTIKLNLNGSPRKFLIMHQGNPSTSMYDASCDGTWVRMKEAYENRQWDSSNNDYANSDVDAWLNGTFLNMLDQDIREQGVKQVKIPYRPGSGSSVNVNTGANGLSRKAFLLSIREMGLSPSYSPNDGVTLAYYSGGGTKVINLNGSPARAWSRSPYLDYSSVNHSVWSVEADGDAYYWFCVNSYAVAPALILDSNLYVSDDGSILTNEPPTAPGSIDVTGVVSGGQATITLTAATDPDGTVESYRYERQVDGGGWQQFADVNSLTQTDQIGSDWGTIAYRACAVDDAGAVGPYVTSEQYDVNVGWVLIGGPSTAMGQQIKPFTLSANIGVSGQTGVTGIAVTGYLDGKKVLDTTINQNDNAEIYVDTRILASGQHTIQMTAEKTDLLPANKAWQFAIPFNALPAGGRAEQLRDDQGNPIFPRTTSQQVIGKNGLPVQNDLDNIEKRFSGLTGHLEPVDAVFLGTAGAQTELPRESDVHYCFGVYSSAGSTDFTMVLVPAGINRAGTLDGNVGVTPSADKFTVVLNGSNAAIVQYFKFVVDAEAEVTTNPSALFTPLSQPHVFSASGGSTSSVTDQTEALQTIIADNANANYYVLEDTDGNKYYVAAGSVIQPSTESFTGPVYQDDQATTLYAGRTLVLMDTSNVAALFQPLAATVYDVTTQGTSVSSGSNLNETLLAMIEAQPTWHRYSIPGNDGETYYVLSEDTIQESASSAPNVYYCTDGSTYYTGGELSLFYVGNVGDTMTFAGQQWIVAHKTATEAYLTLKELSGNSTWNNLDSTCQTWESNHLNASQKAILKTITAGNTSGKVFVATKDQMDGGFSYFNSDSRRQANNWYWTSTGDRSGSAWNVSTDGSLVYYGYSTSDSGGFRPSVCIDLTLF